MNMIDAALRSEICCSNNLMPAETVLITEKIQTISWYVGQWTGKNDLKTCHYLNILVFFCATGVTCYSGNWIY